MDINPMDKVAWFLLTLGKIESQKEFCQAISISIEMLKPPYMC